MPVSPFTHRPADKRGLGLTFLGMMAQEQIPVPSGDYVSRYEFDAVVSSLREEMEMLRQIARTPWYVKWWAEIKRFLHIEGKK